MAPLNVILRKKLVYRITDFFPECLMAEYSPPPLALRLLHHLTMFWRKRVTVLEVLGEDQKYRLLQSGIPESRIRLRRDPSPVEISADLTPLPVPAGLSGKKVLLYSGNFGVAHDYDTFFAGYLNHHRKGNGCVALWLNAQGSRADVLEKMLGEAGVPFHRSKPIPLEQLPSLLVTPDAHLITLRREFMGYVLPSKVYGCLQSGKPIIYIGPQGSDVHLLCKEKADRSNYCQIEVGDDEGVFRALELLGRNKEQ